MCCKLVLFHTKCLFASDREQNCVSDQKAAPATLSLLVSSGCYFEATLPPSFGMWLAPHMCKMQLAGVNGSETWNKPVDETWRCVLILSHKHWWCPNNSSFWGFFFFNLSHTFLCFLLLLPIWHVLDFRGHSFHHALVTKKKQDIWFILQRLHDNGQLDCLLEALTTGNREIEPEVMHLHTVGSFTHIFELQDPTFTQIITDHFFSPRAEINPVLPEKRG